jgi:5'-nucleotidase
MGMAITPRSSVQDFTAEEIGEDFYSCDGKPADLIYFAFLEKKRFLSQGSWDLVVSGVNHGQNVGFDVFHSGTVGAVLIAATVFGCPAAAFSQKLDDQILPGPEEEARVFSIAKDRLPEMLGSLALKRGACWNVNFPGKEPLGEKLSRVGYRSRWWDIQNDNPKNISPDDEDITLLDRGYVTISELRLKVNSES